MTRLPMSTAAAALLRALLNRAGIDRNRILLTDYRSTDWQSLTFVGERHEMRLRIPGPNADEIYRAMTGELADAEFRFAARFWRMSQYSERRRMRATAPSPSA